MDITTILWPMLSLGSMGLIFGLGLGYAGVKFYVWEDQKLSMIRDCLPNVNCGGCGYSGCDSFATAVFNGEAPPDGCPVGGAACAHSIGEILGVEVKPKERQAAFIKCGGDCVKSTFRYDYYGLHDCKAAMQLAGGGSKSCVYGCLGGGSCEVACQFGAISMVDGIAFVDREKCTACGKCIEACPKKLIIMTPYRVRMEVACNSRDSGKIVRSYCEVGCIGCKLCVKACEHSAINVENNLAEIDMDKCISCGECIKKCPRHAIIDVQKESISSTSSEKAI